MASAAPLTNIRGVTVWKPSGIGFTFPFIYLLLLCEIEGDHFVKINGRYCQAYYATGFTIDRRFSADQEMRFADAATVRHANAYLLPRRGDDFADRPFHHHRVGQVHEMSGDGVLLHPERDVQHAASFHRQWLLFIARPGDGVLQHQPVISGEHFPKRSVNIEREIDNAPASHLAGEDAWNVGVRDARKDLFHRKVGV